jgi:glycosyltransferase involved in cell wall biosynthesis
VTRSTPDQDLPEIDGARVAIVNWRDPWHPDAGGAERYAWAMARGLARRGAAVSFLTARAPGQSRREARDGIQLIRAGGRFTVYPLLLGWLLAHRRRFDAVLDCQNGIPFFTPCVLPRRVPVLCVLHHVHTAQFGVHFGWWLTRLGQLLEGPAARLAYRRHACVAVSPSTVAAMRERLRWTGDIYLIPNGAPGADAGGAAPARADAGGADRTCPDPARPDEGSADPGGADAACPDPACAGPARPDPCRPDSESPDPARPDPARAEAPGEPGRSVVWVGRLVAHKRAELLLPVAARLRAAGISIDIVGDGPAAGRLAAAAEASGLGGAVRLRGFLSEADKQAVVAGALLHLSTSQGEGWGLCVIEAAALGVPTVAFDVDGLRDAVRDGQTGWLARDGERIEDTAQRALRELADPRRRAAMAAACRQWAAQLDWDHSAARMAALLAACVQAGSARARNRGAWIVTWPGARGAVLAEGPVLDILLARHPGAALLRPATPLERLLGRPGAGAGARVTASAAGQPS